MEEEIKVLKKKRGTIKARLTLFEKFIKGVQTVGDSLERSKIIEIEQRIQDTESLVTAFDQIQSELESVADDFDVQLVEREEFDNKFYSILSLAKEMLEKYDQNDNNSIVRSQASVKSVKSSNSTSNANPTDGVKLPEIELPKFDGSYHNWLDFRDIFQSLIHDNAKINEIQKFHYLRASLVGSAPQVIQSIEFCAANYDVAWKTLCERFNNTNLLIQNHINAIFKMDPIKDESASKIRNLSDLLFKHLTSLKQLGEPTEHWDTLIIYIISSKLDFNTAREWERLKAKQSNSCTLEYFKNFLKQRADLLENMEMNRDNMRNEKRSSTANRDNIYFNRDNKRGNTRGMFVNSQENANKNVKSSSYTCFYCNNAHSIFYCTDFLKLSAQDRITKAKDLKLCTNCLRRNHLLKDCKLSGCRLCGARHNTILHIERSNQTVGVGLSNQENIQDEPINVVQNTACHLVSVQGALLCTARVQVRDDTGAFISARALLDCGSQSSFITTELSNKLNLPKFKTDMTITGISNKVSRSTDRCQLKIRSSINSYSFDLTCFVLEQITSDLPEIQINRPLLKIPDHIQLADPDFDLTQKIDLLIGADSFWHLLGTKKRELGTNGLILYSTRIGWIVTGPLASFSNNTICNLSTNSLIQDQLTKFWEVEEISNIKPLSNEESLCEKHFKDNLSYSSDGRFIVSLPFKNPPERLGNSREIAIKRFLNLERKLLKNDHLRVLYQNFLNEYEQLGHMTEINDTNENSKPEYYLPHHGVLREASSTTKLRVVFNASSPSSSGISLNDILMNGPIIQSDLFSILLRFRIRPIVVSSDIKMMYRQVLIAPEDRNLQKIIWRSSPDESIRTFQLNTVTYGTTSGSFLAIRSLHEVANECEDHYPKVSNIIKKDMYVDDLLTSFDSVDEVENIIKILSEVLERRGFELRKWKSNHPEIIRKLNLDSDDNTIHFSENKDYDSKILGLSWRCMQDILTYKISPNEDVNSKQITKRVILSRIATVFDPLGLLSPCIIIAKVLLQKLWAENLTWDQPLPNYILSSWLEFASDLNLLNSIGITRKVCCNDPSFISLHGFSDASESSYGACVYILSKTKGGHIECNLLCAKSKVAPLKSLTVPRLELCAALLLSQLLSKVLSSMDIKFNEVYCWSDSTIVLGWLQISPNLLKSFVDNRVAEIQKLTNKFKWRHVPTADNPADLVSRGVRPKDIINLKMWWHGPTWLLYNQSDWPTNRFVSDNLPEMRQCSLVVTLPITYFPFENFSNLTKLKRSVAFIYRFISNSRISIEKRVFTPLTLSELENSFEKIIRLAQMESFPEEYSLLSKKSELSTNSRILSLKPFLDNQGLLRVGGRLSNSDFSYFKKHPILLSPKHHVTNLIMQLEHENLLHAGPQLLLSNVREKFWPISGRNLARKIVRSCVKCSRYNHQNIQPIMGDLPAARVQKALPFFKVGVDYAGPFLVKDRRGRGCKTIKCWVSVFVCLTTRAIHLELILSLSSDDFLQAFHRFISRRGKPSEVFSDNGTNFIRANKDLLLMGQFLQDNNTVISQSVENIGIKWHFIPPNSPHFGGIWEAGVKSLKYHLKRVVGSYTLFIFDFQTLLVRIEAVLNSRPLCPLSSNPDDYSPLSPAHFLIGRPATAVLEPSVVNLQENRLSQFQLLQKIHEQFWNRWHHEYISELQQRQKWKQSIGSLKTGQLVLIKDNNVPPMKWRLGRVLDLIHGQDGVCRVATIKTADGVATRAVVRLCPLPIES